MRHRNGRVSNWFKEKTGSLGLSSGGPIPDSPPFSSSCVLSLSGFFPSLLFQGRNKGGSRRSGKASSKEEDLSGSNRKLVQDSIPLSKNHYKETKNIDLDGDEKEDYKEKHISSSGSIQNETGMEEKKDDETKKLISSSFGWATNNS